MRFTLTSLIIFMMSLTVSCKEDETTGTCTGCCSGMGLTVCRENVTNKMCDQYNKEKSLGYTWEFSEGETCPATP